MIAKYDAKYGSAAIEIIRAATAAIAKQYYANFANEWEPYENALRVVLNAAGVPITHVLGYFGFTFEAYRVTRSFDGALASAEVQNLITKYAAMGLAQPTLEAIRDEVFTITPPPL